MSTPSKFSLTFTDVAASPLWTPGLVLRSVLTQQGSCCQHGWAASPTQVERSSKDLLLLAPRLWMTNHVCVGSLSTSLLTHVRMPLADPGSFFYTFGLALVERADLRRIFASHRCLALALALLCFFSPWGVCGVRVGVPWSPASRAKAATLRARPV